jgi:hypothetical protein
MPTRTIDIQDGDKDRIYRLTVNYDRLCEEFEVGLGASLEINSVRCTEIVVYCDGYGYSVRPSDAAEHRRPESAVGDFCREKFKEEIEAELNAADSLVLDNAA